MLVRSFNELSDLVSKTQASINMQPELYLRISIFNQLYIRRGSMSLAAIAQQLACGIFYSAHFMCHWIYYKSTFMKSTSLYILQSVLSLLVAFN